MKISIFRWVSFFPISRSLEALANLPFRLPSPDSLRMDSLLVNSSRELPPVKLVFSAKYPVQWVAPKEEPAMYLGDSLYPKPGYQTAKMLIPRQFVSLPAACRDLPILSAFVPNQQRNLLRQLAIRWATKEPVALVDYPHHHHDHPYPSWRGGSLNKSWRGHNDSYW